jgi:acyl-coenzyme A thioesterase PaaI-like protein
METRRHESWRTRLTRWGFNLHPTYWSTGGRITFIASDWREVHVKLPLSWRTRNYVGTIFGGSMYSALDPMYMIMLIKVLGPGYVVWDKAASIRFLRPGRGTLHARFVVEDETVAEIRTALESAEKVERSFSVELVDAGGALHATVEKLLHIQRRRRSSADS